jgi:dolichol kinase
MHMLFTALALFIVFLLIVCAEYFSRTGRVHSEVTRKFVHMSVGTFVATWPFFLSWREIALVGLAFLLVVIVSVQFNIFRSIHGVNRNAVGEIMFAIVITTLAGLSGNKWIFAAAMLHLSLADGFAALIGTAFGKHGGPYRVFGSPKSVAGTTTFLLVSSVIIGIYAHVTHQTDWGMLVLLPPLAAAAENIGGYGLDNLIVPMIVVAVLRLA